MAFTTGFTIYYPITETCGPQVLQTPAGAAVVTNVAAGDPNPNQPNPLEIIETYTCGAPSYEGLPPNSDS